jgi:peptide-methionine (R)-S-oxide reductase
MESFELTEEQWQQRLSPEAFYVLRKKGTERAFTGIYWNSKEKGIYHCGGCDLELFRSDDKFDSGTGWPSFYRPIQPDRVRERIDRSHGMIRREVVCGRCGGHLGHVFDDVPRHLGERYCLNSASLRIQKPEDK